MDTVDGYKERRLVALYDLFNAFRDDTVFYLDLAAELSATSIVDIGCGTGLLATELARRGHRVTGADPSPAMIDFARNRPGGELVRWLEGDASAVGPTEADLLLMTGHVAQIISDEDMWRTTLAAAHRALRPRGHIAFESRNPLAQAWKKWTLEASFDRLPDTPFGPIDIWDRVMDVQDGLVRIEGHCRFASTGEDLITYEELRFRTQQEIQDALTAIGFDVQHMYGDWDRSPMEARSREIIVVASRE